MAIVANAKLLDPEQSQRSPELEKVLFKFGREYGGKEVEIDKVKLSDSIEIRDGNKFKDVEIDKNIAKEFKDRAGEYYLKETAGYLCVFKRSDNSGGGGVMPDSKDWEQRLLDLMPLGKAAPAPAASMTPDQMKERIAQLEKDLAAARQDATNANENATKAIQAATDRERQAAEAERAAQRKIIDATKKDQEAQAKLSSSTIDPEIVKKWLREPANFETATRVASEPIHSLYLLPEYRWSVERAIQKATTNQLGVIKDDASNSSVISYEAYKAMTVFVMERNLDQRDNPKDKRIPAPGYLTEEAFRKGYEEFVRCHKVWCSDDYRKAHTSTPARRARGGEEALITSGLRP